MTNEEIRKKIQDFYGYKRPSSVSPGLVRFIAGMLASHEKEMLEEIVKEIEGIVFKTDWIEESKSTYGKLLNLRDSLRSKLKKLQ